MMTAIQRFEALRVLDGMQHHSYFGCSQEWFQSDWQRLSGCGPATAANIYMYKEYCRLQSALPDDFHDKVHWQLVMDDVWQYVTPTRHGIPAAALLVEGFSNYLADRDFLVKPQILDIPEDADKRPPLAVVCRFINNALTADEPVAFLNLCNGKESNLDKWHWVTIVACDIVPDSVIVKIADEGMLKTIDMSLWYDTTTRGGGLACFL